MAASAPINDALTADADDLGVKVFVGNLAFSTTSDDLKETFGSAGQVLEAMVIKRGSRSLGYGFVTYANAEDATKAVSHFDKSDFKERKINVEVAKPAKTAPGGGLADAAAEAAQASGWGDSGATSSRGARRGRGGRGRRGEPRSRIQPDGEADGGVDGITNGIADLSTGDSRGRGGRRGRGRGRGRGVRRGPVGAPEGEPSSTLLFVANLPFQLDDEGLKEIFKEYKVTSAHVVIRKYGAAAGKSKGFGFVEVANETEQKRAVTELNGKEIDTPAGARELSVKVAINAAHAGEDVDPETTASVTATSAADAAANA